MADFVLCRSKREHTHASSVSAGLTPDSGPDVKGILRGLGYGGNHVVDEGKRLAFRVVHGPLHQGGALGTLDLSGLHPHNRFYHSGHSFLAK